MAYPIAAFVTGYLAERGFDRRYLTSVIAMFAGLITLFAGGVAWLAFFAAGASGSVGFSAALENGLYPFVLPDFIKVCIASGVLPAVWKFLGPSKDA
jgi:biotin transporter BioY